MPDVGDPAIDFTGADLIHPGDVTLSDYSGEVILLAFISDW